MSRQSRILSICVITFCLSACAYSIRPAADTACSTSGSSVDEFVPVVVEDLKLLLPPSSKLVAENTYDARHWAWNTSIGQVSISWISEIARKSLLKASGVNSCAANADGVIFNIETVGTRLTAISTPIYETGAGLFVTIDGVRGKQKINGYRIIESIRISKPER